MPGEKNNSNATWQTYLKHGLYGLGIRGGTTFLYANLGDTIRTLAQTQNLSSRQVYANAIKEKGFVAGTWDLHTRGMLPNLLRLGSREFTRAMIMSFLEGNVSSDIGKALVMTSIDSVASVPDTVKVLQQSNPAYRNRWLYPFMMYTKGVLPTAYRQGLRWGAVLVVKPPIIKFLQDSQDVHRLTNSEIKLLGTLLVGVIAGALVVPVDVPKSRIQNGQGIKSITVDLVKKVYKEGISILNKKGLIQSMLAANQNSKGSSSFFWTVADIILNKGVRALGRGGLPKALITMNAVFCTSAVQELIKMDAEKLAQAQPKVSFKFFTNNEREQMDTTPSAKEASSQNKTGPGCK